MIHLSCAEYAFPLLPPAHRFALLRLLGFEYVDIGLFERSYGFMPSQLLADPMTFLNRLQQDLRSAGLSVSDMFLQTGVDPAVSSANDESSLVRDRNRKTFLLTLELCSAVGCTHVTGLPGVWHEGMEPAKAFALAADEARWRYDEARKAGMSYAIEPHLDSICYDIESTIFFLDAAPGLTLTLDYGHFVSAGISSHAIHRLLPFASHIHVRGGALHRLQTPMSENEIDFDGMVHRLIEQKYEGFLVVEYVWAEWKQCNRTDNVSETILMQRQLAGLMKPSHFKI